MNKCELLNLTIQRLATGGATPILPPEYQQVEYLQSTGTQYVDTGILLSDNYERVEVKLNVTSANNRSRYFSSWSDSLNRGAIIAYGTSTNPLGNIYVGSTDYSITNTAINTDYTIDLTADNGLLTGSYCGVNVNKSYNGSVVTGYKIGLFCEFNNQGASGQCTAKIYYFRLHTSAGLQRDYIPCYRKLDNKPGMYDIVNDTFYTNAGTGEFTAGNNV